MKATIELYEPFRSERGWTARASVRLESGWIGIEATAPDAVTARALARFQAWMADKLQDRSIKLSARKGLDRMSGNLRGFAALLKPVARRYGVTDKALGVAAQKIAAAERGHKPTLARIASVKAAANEGDVAAQRTHAVLQTVAAAKRIDPDKGVRKLQALARAHLVLKKATDGEQNARCKICEIDAGAASGSERAIAALAFLAVADELLEGSAVAIQAEEGSAVGCETSCSGCERQRQGPVAAAVGASWRRGLVPPGINKAGNTTDVHGLLVELRTLRARRRGYRRAA
jgi:hypothetical protein